MSQVTITRRSRKIGHGVNTSPKEYFTPNGDSHLYVPAPTSPDFEGTIKQVFNYIQTDRFIRSLQSGGTIYSSAFFVNGQKIDTNSEAWQYELDRLIDGEIDSLVVPLVETE